MISVRPDGRMAGQLAGQLIICMWQKNFNITVFSDTINIINVKLGRMVVLTELFPFIPLSITLIVFQGNNSVKQF